MIKKYDFFIKMEYIEQSDEVDCSFCKCYTLPGFYSKIEIACDIYAQICVRCIREINEFREKW